MFLRLNIFFLLVFFINAFGSVAPNPFLKPGSKQKPPVPAKPSFTPKQIIRPDLAKELEFKGYFIFKDEVYFSLFNKKVNYGEWIKINEKTLEEISAESFDLDTETLTVAFEGQTFELNLLGPTATNGIPSPSSPSQFISKSTSNPSVSSEPKVMPPKPKSTPVIPSFLVNKQTTNPFPSFSGKSGNLNPSSSAISSRIPGLPYPGFVPRRSIPRTSISPISNPSSGQSSNPSIINNENNSNAGTSSGVGSNVGNNPEIPDVDLNFNDELDLNSLPPPPPPPNILPPSPPPNLVPSREE